MSEEKEKEQEQEQERGRGLESASVSEQEPGASASAPASTPVPVLWEQQGHIGYIRLNRPEQLNAINRAMLDALGALIEQIGNNSRDIRVVVIEGAGRAFSSGADLKERQTMGSPEDIRQSIHRIKTVLAALEQLPQPTIAALSGLAFGGGLELALACDFRFALRGVKLGLTEVGLGIIPGGGGTQRLPRLIGAARAKELILTARRITAEQAYELGLLSGVADDMALLHASVSQLAAELLQAAPIAVYQAKLAINRGLDTNLQAGMDIETAAYEVTIPTKDRQEALEAFRTKRAPHFTGE
ncbi:enoyl-CoA hydratase-related protein [Paenibacillus sp. OV219]|uniref:enoyl-CoA hydratase-related protein n=1 Tax=Paenibacillus sp. OV219 TaxID=1884377 RepID=UPI0008C6A0B6|nr:enoyl-CoA hydratase-related protein [Paenibacillus sp. OV219]SEP00274.1 Enoyl-CoA hydratase/carnithine racemase [Paenibacillus sp. OV219]